MEYQEILANLEQIEQNHQMESKERVVQVQELLRRCNQLFGTARSIDQLVMDATVLEKIAQIMVKIIDQT